VPKVMVVGFAMLLVQLSNTGGAVDAENVVAGRPHVDSDLAAKRASRVRGHRQRTTARDHRVDRIQVAADADVAPNTTVASAAAVSVYILMLRIGVSLPGGSRQLQYDPVRSS
jgi:hypothetical protein